MGLKTLFGEISKSVWTIYFLNFCLAFSTLGVESFFSVYLKELGLGLVNIGYLYGLTILLSGVVVVVFGFFSDRIGKKKIILLALIEYLVFVAGLMITKSYYSLVALKLIAEIARATWWTGLYSYYFDFVHTKEKAVGTAKLLLMYLLASFLSPGISGIIINNYGYGGLFILSTSLLVLLFVFTLTVIRETKSKHEAITFRKEMVDLISNSHYIKISLAMSFLMMGGVFFVVFLPIYLKDALGWSYPLIGLLISCVSVLVFILQLPVGKFVSGISSRYIIPLSNIFLSAGLFLVVHFISFFNFLTSRLLVDLSLAGSRIKSNVVIVALTSKKEHGGAVAFFTFLNNAAISVLMFLSGYLINAYGFIFVLEGLAVASLVVALSFYFTYTKEFAKLELIIHQQKFKLKHHHFYLFHHHSDAPLSVHHLQKHLK